MWRNYDDIQVIIPNILHELDIGFVLQMEDKTVQDKAESNIVVTLCGKSNGRRESVQENVYHAGKVMIYDRQLQCGHCC